MKAHIFFAALVILASLISCAQMNPHPMEMTSAVRNAKTSVDHEALAKHYEDAAHEMQLTKRAQDLQAHCWSLIKSYEQAVEANMSMAKIHHQIAGEVK